MMTKQGNAEATAKVTDPKRQQKEETHTEWMERLSDERAQEAIDAEPEAKEKP